VKRGKARLLGKRAAIALLWIFGLLWSLALLVGVVASILLDADMLVDAGGPWMLLAFLVVPACVATPWVVGRVKDYREDKYWVRRGEELAQQQTPQQSPSGWRTLREDDVSPDGIAALSEAERRARGEDSAP
jgi:hypothetical protein